MEFVWRLVFIFFVSIVSFLDPELLGLTHNLVSDYRNKGDLHSVRHKNLDFQHSLGLILIINAIN